jgi:hypothetical protein
MFASMGASQWPISGVHISVSVGPMHLQAVSDYGGQQFDGYTRWSTAAVKQNIPFYPTCKCVMIRRCANDFAIEQTVGEGVQVADDVDCVHVQSVTG